MAIMGHGLLYRRSKNMAQPPKLVDARPPCANGTVCPGESTKGDRKIDVATVTVEMRMNRIRFD
jgi:hypothetical protein